MVAAAPVRSCVRVQGLSPYNTRVFKGADGSLVIKVASAATGELAGLTADVVFEGAKPPAPRVLCRRVELALWATHSTELTWTALYLCSASRCALVCFPFAVAVGLNIAAPVVVCFQVARCGWSEETTRPCSRGCALP